MLTRQSSRLRLLRQAFLTTLSVLMIAGGLFAFTLAPAPRVAAQTGYERVTFAATVIKPDPRLARLRYLHRWHQLHQAHLAYLHAKARAAALAAYAAAHPRVTIAHAAPVTVTAHVSAGSYSGRQACIISRESGGNSQIWNATGHYGLYQFSYSTWVAHGGIAADFGHASVAEQNQVFYATVAVDGYSDWAPYDGC